MRWLPDRRGGGGDKGMEGMFVKQILQLLGWLNVKRVKEKRKQDVKLLVGSEYTPQFGQGRALLEFWCPGGTGETVPSFSRRVWVILCSAHCSFPALLKPPQASVLPKCRELLGIRMSGAGEELGLVLTGAPG